MNPYFIDFEIFQSASESFPEQYITGKNEKELLIVIREEENNAENIQFLKKILQAVNRNLENDAYLARIPKNTHYSISPIIHRGCKQVIIFGFQAKDVGFSFNTPLYKPLKILDVEYLFAHHLVDISKKQDLKKALWAALQNIFK